MVKLKTEVQNNISEIIPDFVKKKKFDKLVNEGKKTYEKIKNRNTDPEVLKKIEKEYNDVINARNYAKSEQSINWTELVAQEYSALKKEVMDLGRYLKADISNYSFDTKKFLIKDENNILISNWKKTPKRILNKIEKNTEIYLNWNISLKNLSHNEIWWMLSWIEILIQSWKSSIKEKIINELSQDPKWLIFLKNNWTKIATNLQFEAKLIQPLFNDIIASASKAINIQITKYLKENNPDITDIEINDILSKINTELSKWTDMHKIITLLEKFKWVKSNAEFTDFIWNIIDLKSVETYFIKENIEINETDAKDGYKEAIKNNDSIEEVEKLKAKVEKTKKELKKTSSILKKQETQVKILETVSKSDKLSNTFINKTKDWLNDVEINKELIVIAKKEWLIELSNELEQTLTTFEQIQIETEILNETESIETNLNDIESNNETLNEFTPVSTITYENWEELNYIKTSNWFNIDDWKENSEGIDITKDEFQRISWKEGYKAKENLIIFHDFFIKEVNIPIIWEKRKEILLAIWSRDIQNDKDSIKKWELELITNNILELIYWEKFNLKLQSAKLKLNKFSEHSSTLSDNKTYWIRWTWKLEKMMIDRLIIENWKFNIQKFRDIKKIWLINTKEEN